MRLAVIPLFYRSGIFLIFPLFIASQLIHLKASAQAGPSITVTQQPNGANTCAGKSLTLSTNATGTTNITYQWQKYNPSTQAFDNITNGGTYSGASTINLTISNIQKSEAGNYQCFIQGDNASPVSTNIVIINVSVLPVTTSGESCGPGSVVLSASGAAARIDHYNWYTDPVNALPIPNETSATYTTPVLNTTTTFWVSVANLSCETERIPVTATINGPAKPVITASVPIINNAITICSTSDLSLIAPSGFSGYFWSNQSASKQIDVSVSNTYSVTVTDANDCASPPSDGVTVVVIPGPCNNAPPVISAASESTAIGGKISINLLDLVSDPDNNLVLATLSITEQPSSDAVATIENTNLVLDYSGIAFSGTEFLRIQVCDALSECTQQQLTIEVASEIEIYNALSPNGDTKNDIFMIKYIEILESTKNNKVTIFDRWGDVVFETNNYNNTTSVFKGLSSGGKELPSGTYYYRIDFTNHSSKTGYISLKR